MVSFKCWVKDVLIWTVSVRPLDSWQWQWLSSAQIFYQFHLLVMEEWKLCIQENVSKYVTRSMFLGWLIIFVKFFVSYFRCPQQYQNVHGLQKTSTCSASVFWNMKIMSKRYTCNCDIPFLIITTNNSRYMHFCYLHFCIPMVLFQCYEEH
jgi:hypothetical protein